jgi:phenylpyruvate tautomerase PptA (4-oxalocrotonate tautomerase family)
MPIAYLDVPESIQIDKKKKLVQEIYDALHEAYPFPDDVRIFLREWSIDSVSQNGRLGSEPARPVLMMQVPQGVSIDAKRKMMQGINSAVAEAYHLPEFVIIMHENPPDVGSLDGRLFSDNQGRVDAQKKT